MREGLMMDDYPLSLTAIATRAEHYAPGRPVTFRRPDGSIGRRTLGECAERAHRLAGALSAAGIGAGDPVATLMWNQPEHLEAYFALPAMGAVLHTLNPRLHPDELSFIVNDAEDRAIIVDGSLLEVFESFCDARAFEHVIVLRHDEDLPDGYLDYEAVHRRRRAAALARGQRARGRGDLLHVGNDRPPQGRRLLAPGARPALARRRTARRQPPLLAGRDPARRPDVPRQRVGADLQRRAARRRARPARAQARRGQRARSDGAGARHPQRRRADGVDGRPAGA